MFRCAAAATIYLGAVAVSVLTLPALVFSSEHAASMAAHNLRLAWCGAIPIVVGGALYQRRLRWLLYGAAAMGVAAPFSVVEVARDPNLLSGLVVLLLCAGAMAVFVLASEEVPMMESRSQDDSSRPKAVISNRQIVLGLGVGIAAAAVSIGVALLPAGMNPADSAYTQRLPLAWFLGTSLQGLLAAGAWLAALHLACPSASARRLALAVATVALLSAVIPSATIVSVHWTHALIGLYAVAVGVGAFACVSSAAGMCRRMT